MANEVLDYLDKKHMTYNLADGARGKEAILTTCPFCKDNRNHFYFNIPNQVYYCHKCGQSGSLFTLKAELGDVASVYKMPAVVEEESISDEEAKRIDEANQLLLKDRETLLYVAERAFSKEAIMHFKLGLSIEEGKKWLWFPYIDAVGKVKNVKKRCLEKKDFRRWIGKDSILFNEVALNTQSDHIIICEGESDTVALWSTGIHNVVGVPTGAKAINDNWIQQLDKYQRIYIAYDQDDAGYEGTYILGRRLGLERCYRIVLPSDVKDINDYIKQGHTREHIQKRIDEAKLLDVQYVDSLAGEMEKYLRSKWIHHVKEQDTLQLPWANLHNLTDGFVAGDLIILASRPGVGKTEFALNLLYDYSKLGIPTLLFSLEMRIERLLPRFAARHLQMDSREVSTFDLMSRVYKEMKDFPLYLAYVYKKPNFEFVADTIRMCVRRYGTKFVVFDNLHFLVRSMSDQVREVSVIVQGFKLLAEELGIPVLLIARPRKTSSRVIGNIDLKDSADIEGDADIIILLHREPKNRDKDTDNVITGIFESKCIVKVSKCRYAAGGDVYLDFKDSTCTITEWKG